jgi:hypothetical protein
MISCAGFSSALGGIASAALVSADAQTGNANSEAAQNKVVFVRRERVASMGRMSDIRLSVIYGNYGRN